MQQTRLRLLTALCAYAALAATAQDAPLGGDEESCMPSQLIPSGYSAYTLETDDDDGTEVSEAIWHPNGYYNDGHNRMGSSATDAYDVGLRFRLPDVKPGDEFVYARLAVPATAEGMSDVAFNVRILGFDENGVAPFGARRPSLAPKTEAYKIWRHESDWQAAEGATDCDPLIRYSPDISAIINEIVGRPGWGGGAYGKTIGLVLEDDGTWDSHFLTMRDYYVVTHAGCPGKQVGPVLELYRDVRSTFLGRELLGCPTDHGVTINVLSLLDLEMYVDYGVSPDVYTHHTPATFCEGGAPFEVQLTNLAFDTRYYYRLRYRRPGNSVYKPGPRRTFHTQRDSTNDFVFAVQADSEMHDSIRLKNRDATGLYYLTLKNIAADRPDFIVDLGDTFHCESYSGRDVLDFEEAVGRYVSQRRFLDIICHSSPFFLALGNHEGEQGWRLDGTPHNVAVWGANARKLIYPLPTPNNFTSGNQTPDPWTGLRENYYAWEWGDALFVVLDPFWYTASKPHDRPEGEPGSGDNWDWTLGRIQYDWLRETLEASNANYKFVFTHHLIGGVNTYGRGGIEAASDSLGGTGSFEWGGEDLDGKYDFNRKRPDWGVPIHDMLVENDVSIVFHGHDHAFVKQELDGIIYQECPKPSDAAYGSGHIAVAHYYNGDAVNNSGHLRVTVGPLGVTVHYVRSYLPGDGPNGDIAYSYTVYPSASH